MEDEMCDDPECCGCPMMWAISRCHQMEMHPQDVVNMFFDYLREAYAEEAIFEVNMDVERGALH